MTLLFAQPYDISANGFFFETEEEYNEKAAALRNSSGWPVEEFEIQFIDGESIDAELFEALSIQQGNFGAFLNEVDTWSDEEKAILIIAVGKAGYEFTLGTDIPDEFDIDLYEIDNLRNLAMQFVEEGLFGSIPESIQHYLDYDAIARDLSMDYSEITINRTRYVYRCC